VFEVGECQWWTENGVEFQMIEWRMSQEERKKNCMDRSFGIGLLDCIAH